MLKEAYVSMLGSERAIKEGFDSLIQSAKQNLNVLEKPKAMSNPSPTLVYWQDEIGEHLFYTEALRVSSS